MLHAKLLELEKQFSPSVLTPLSSPLLTQKKIECWVKRDDLIHPVISGNKWRKLKYILHHALMLNTHTLISMGGAYSNHLHALAFVGKQLDLKTIAFIRGEQPKELNPTLLDIKRWGMELRFISRAEYRDLRQYKKYNAFPAIKEGEYWLPEGGATDLALQGVAEIIAEIDVTFDSVCVPCGTGTTMAGLLEATTQKQTVIGFSAVKGGDFLMADIHRLLSPEAIAKNTGKMQLDYHFGGFAKRNNELLLFIREFLDQQGIELEPVYTGKMFYGLFKMIEHDFFTAGQTLIIIHTGGLQGAR